MGRTELALVVLVAIVVALCVAARPTRPERVRGVDVRALVASYKESPATIDRLRRLCPDRAHPRAYPESFAGVGEALGARWNVPPDQSYHKQGVLVQSYAPSEVKLEALAEWVARELGIGEPVAVVEVKCKTHTARSNGVWLHTDFRATADRHVLVLVYLSDLNPSDGGQLHIYTHRSEVGDEEEVDGYQTGRLSPLPTVCATAGIGGEWTDGRRRFECVRTIVPRKGLVVAMDCRSHRNVHAVSAMETGTARMLCEMWFRVDAKRVLNRTYVGTSYARAASDDTHATLFRALSTACFSPQQRAHVEDLNRRLPLDIFDFVVWGIQDKPSGMGLEYYFYFAPSEWRAHWEAIRRFLGAACLVETLRVEFEPGMISVDIPLSPDARVESVDVYHLANHREGVCHTQRVSGGPVHKNTYVFVHKPPRRDRAFRPDDDATTAASDAQVLALAKQVGVPPKHLRFRDWRVSVCLATKSAGRRGVYYSGVPLRDMQLAASDAMAQSISDLQGATVLVDVGYDIVDDKRVSFCVYGCFLRNEEDVD